MTTTQRRVAAIVSIIALAYLSFGVSVYVQGLRSQLSIHICPSGTAFPFERHVQGVDGVAQIVTELPDCPKQSFQMRREIGTAPVIIFGWLPLMIAKMSTEPAGTQGKDIITTPALSDGTSARGLGKFRASPIENGVKAYSSEKFGISFNYPIDYMLSEGKGEGGSAVESYFIGLYPRPAPAPELPPGVQIDTEPGPGIYFGFYRKAVQADSFDKWVRKQMIYRAGEGNFQDPTLHPITVDDIPAVRYLDTSGLYQRDTVLFRHGDWMVQIAADDATYFKTDFDSILSSITLH